MSYELLILAFIMLVFCFLMQLFTVKAMFSLFNSVRPEGTREIKPIKLAEKSHKRTHEQTDEHAEKERKQYEAIMRNLERFDGTELGQEEVG